MICPVSNCECIVENCDWYVKADKTCKLEEMFKSLNKIANKGGEVE